MWATERDPIALLAAKIGDDSAVAALQEQVDAEVESAVAYALDAPYPDPDEVDEHVFA